MLTGAAPLPPTHIYIGVYTHMDEWMSIGTLVLWRTLIHIAKYFFTSIGIHLSFVVVQHMEYCAAWKPFTPALYPLWPHISLFSLVLNPSLCCQPQGLLDLHSEQSAPGPLHTLCPLPRTLSPLINTQLVPWPPSSFGSNLFSEGSSLTTLFKMGPLPCTPYFSL